MSTYRRLVTSSVGFSFVVVGVTGVIFKLFFKNHALEEIHGWLGLAMVAAALFHIVQNWRSLRRHLRDVRVYALLVPIAVVCLVFARPNEPARGVNPRRVMRALTQANANDVARTFHKDISRVLASMKADGMGDGSADDTIEQLAQKNQQPPEKILSYFAM